MKKERLFFESDAEVAEYLGLGVSEFLKLRAVGKFAVTPRPRDAEPVYWKEDIDKWIAGGRPPASICRDPSGVGL